MDEGGQVWHYGLMAERRAEVLTETPELDFLRRKIEGYGQPVLDLACGTGRLLLPLLAEGVDIDGADISADMLAHCRRKAESRGYQPTLLEQTYTRQVRLEKWDSDHKIAEKEYTLHGNMYLKSEIQLMLEEAGFDPIKLFGGYSDQPASPSHEELVFVAEKPVT